MSLTYPEVGATAGELPSGYQHLGPFRLWAPCRVVYVVDEPDRKGFANGTVQGHPERGEESVVVSIDEDGEVTFEVTAFSRPVRWFVRLGGPVTKGIQRRMTWRYLEAVLPTPG